MQKEEADPLIWANTLSTVGGEETEVKKRSTKLRWLGLVNEGPGKKGSERVKPE